MRAGMVAALLLAGAAAPVAADLATSYAALQRRLTWLVPVPLRYAAAQDALQDMDPVLQLMLELMARDDVLVLLRRDGAYSTFVVTGEKGLLPLMAPLADQGKRFERLASEYPRVWIMLTDPRGSWQMQPPEQYAAHLAARYMTIPLAVPVYCSMQGTIKGTTNYYRMQAALLEHVRQVSTSVVSPKFFIELGRVYRAGGDITNALHTYELGASLFPNDPYLQRRTAELYFSNWGDYARAIAFNKEANLAHRRAFGTPMFEALFNSAMAYERLGNKANAEVQYRDILAQLDEYTDPLWESRTRRYYGLLLLSMARTNDALFQFQLDARATVQPPAYSYGMVLDLSAATGQQQLYTDTARTFFNVCGTNDARALVRHAEDVAAREGAAAVRPIITTAKQWMVRNPALVEQLRGTPAWWRTWTNIALRAGVAPTP
jgi:tetratricopeptide (TPR) repeat protein